MKVLVYHNNSCIWHVELIAGIELQYVCIIVPCSRVMCRISSMAIYMNIVNVITFDFISFKYKYNQGQKLMTKCQFFRA